MAKNKYEERLDYQAEMQHNEIAFKTMVKSVRPELYVLMDLLDETQLDPMILFKTMRQLNNIAIGSKYGQVTIYIENGVATFVRGEESDKLNLPVIKEENTKLPS